MSKLTKADAKAHAEACKMLEQDRLTMDQRWFVLENWQESAQHVNSSAGAFFTPIGLARDFALNIGGNRIIDLCAGIGALAFMLQPTRGSEAWPEIVCVEINPDYAAVGRKVVPEARWIVGSVFDLPRDLGRFDYAISNPPFGLTSRAGASSPRYRGRAFEYHVIDIASDLADEGAFIIPQGSSPFRMDGSGFRMHCPAQCAEFEAKTDIRLAVGVSIDTSFHEGDWAGVAPKVEIVTSNFAHARAVRKARKFGPLFAEAAE